MSVITAKTDVAGKSCSIVIVISSRHIFLSKIDVQALAVDTLLSQNWSYRMLVGDIIPELFVTKCFHPFVAIPAR